MSDINKIDNLEKHGPIYAAIEDTFGPRCFNYEPECWCCRAWREYDEITRIHTGGLSRVIERLNTIKDNARDELARLRAENKRLRETMEADFEWSLYAAKVLKAVRELSTENERLREALKPFTNLSMYPDDLGPEMAALIREDSDFDEHENDQATEDVFVRRGDIRLAREVLKETKND